jgi:hypothetical protein
MKKYINPILEVLYLTEEDVIRTSGGYYDNELPLVPFVGNNVEENFE